MSMRRRIGGLIRARQVQEDQARGALQRARLEAEAAAERRRRYEDALGSCPAPDAASAGAYAASLSARHAMGAALNAAIGVAAEFDGTVRERLADLTEAASRRRAMERLAERREESAREADDAAVQFEIDDLAGRSRLVDRRGSDR